MIKMEYKNVYHVGIEEEIIIPEIEGIVIDYDKNQRRVSLLSKDLTKITFIASILMLNNPQTEFTLLK